MERQISLRLIVIFCVLAFTLLFSAIAVSFDSKNSESYSSFVSTSNIDIDGNNQFDALTDGLLILRSMFELSGDPLITGVVANDAVYTDADDIEGRIASLGNKLDIDDDGNVDALTDGLLVLRYLFELREGALTVGVVSPDAKRTEASDIEAYLDQLTTLFIPTLEFTSPELYELIITPAEIDVTNDAVEVVLRMKFSDVSGVEVFSFSDWRRENGGSKSFSTVKMISGDKYEGVYEMVTVFDSDDLSGTWKPGIIYVSDKWGNGSYIFPSFDSCLYEYKVDDVVTRIACPSIPVGPTIKVINAG